MKNKTLVFVVLILIALGVSAFAYYKKQPAGGENVACTMEAKLCPDGSSVGRFGPKCEFAACPTTKESTKAKIGEKILTNGVYIIPEEVVEDSRCPVDVTCIWAGQVRLKTTLQLDSGNTVERQDVTLTLGQALNFKGKNVKLVNVTPDSNSKITLNPSNYTFEFEVK